MPDPLLLTLPYPPSVNHFKAIFNNRLITSRDGREYQKLVADALRRAGVEPFAGEVSARIDVYRPLRSGDLENRFKPVFDCLNGFAYHDDDQISEIIGKRHDDKHNPRVEIEIKPIEPESVLFQASADKNAYRKAAESIVSAINAIDANATLAAKGHLDKALEALAYFPGVLKKVVELPKPEPVPTPAVVAPRPVQAAGRPRVPHPRQVERQWPADAFRKAAGEGAGKI